VDFEIVKSLIQSELKDAEVEVRDLTGTKDHLEIEVKSSAFTGKMLIQQHQILMDILKPRLDTGEIHAVKLKTISK
jgi:stress-induced morphogen